MVSQGHVHILRVTCEGDEPSSSQSHRLVLARLLGLWGGFLGFDRKVIKLCDVLVAGFGIVGIVGSGLRIVVVYLGIRPA